MVGRGAMTNSIEELADSNLILVTGSNTTEAHPVIALRMKRAVRKGAKLIVIDPRKIELTKWAARHVQIKVGTDIPFYNAVANVIINEKLYDERYVNERTEGFTEFARHVQHYPPEYAAEICGVPVEDVYYVAREYSAASPGAAEFPSTERTMYPTVASPATRSRPKRTMLAHCGATATGYCEVKPARYASRTWCRVTDMIAITSTIVPSVPATNPGFSTGFEAREIIINSPTASTIESVSGTIVAAPPRIRPISTSRGRASSSAKPSRT